MVEDTFKSVLALLIIAIAYVAAFPIAFQFAGGALNRNWGKGMNFLRKQQSRVVKKGVETGKRNAGVKITGFVKKNWNAQADEKAGSLGKMSATGRRTLAQALAYGKEREAKRQEQEEQIKRGWQDVHAARSLQGTEEGGHSRYTQRIAGKNQADLERSLSGAVTTVASREAEEGKSRLNLLNYRANQAGLDVKTVVNQLNDFATGKGDGYIRNEATGKGFKIDASTVLAGHDLAASSGEVPALRNYLTSRRMHESLGENETERQEGRRKIDKILEANRGTIMGKGGWDLVNQGENLAYGRRMELKDSDGKGLGRYIEANDEAGKRAAMINAELSTYANDDASSLKEYKVGQVGRLAKGIEAVSTKVDTKGRTVRYIIGDDGTQHELTGLDDKAWGNIIKNTTQAVSDPRLVPSLGSKSGSIDTMAASLGIKQGLDAQGKLTRNIEQRPLSNQASAELGGYSEVDLGRMNGTAANTVVQAQIAQGHAVTPVINKLSPEAASHVVLSLVANQGRQASQLINNDTDVQTLSKIIVDAQTNGTHVDLLRMPLVARKLDAASQSDSVLTTQERDNIVKAAQTEGRASNASAEVINQTIKDRLANKIIVEDAKEKSEVTDLISKALTVRSGAEARLAAVRAANPQRGVDLSPGQTPPAPQYENQAPPVTSQSSPQPYTPPTNPAQVDTARQAQAQLDPEGFRAERAQQRAQAAMPTPPPAPTPPPPPPETPDEAARRWVEEHERTTKYM